MSNWSTRNNSNTKLHFSDYDKEWMYILENYIRPLQAQLLVIVVIVSYIYSTSTWKSIWYFLYNISRLYCWDQHSQNWMNIIRYKSYLFLVWFFKIFVFLTQISIPRLATNYLWCELKQYILILKYENFLTGRRCLEWRPKTIHHFSSFSNSSGMNKWPVWNIYAHRYHLNLPWSFSRAQINFLRHSYT